MTLKAALTGRPLLRTVSGFLRWDIGDGSPAEQRGFVRSLFLDSDTDRLLVLRGATCRNDGDTEHVGN